MEFLTDDCPSIELQAINLFVLMYADDMVLLAETAEGLQKMLDTLVRYTDKWNLTVNTNKTKVMVFRNGGKLREEDKWYFNGGVLETVDEFNYLGILMNFNGKYRKTQQKIAEQGKKALFAITNVCKKNYFNVETQLHVFDTYVCSILNYGAEVWGFHKAPDIEKIHLNFCKRLLGVKKSTANFMVYQELGRLPLGIIRKFRIFKYWLKLKNSDNCILQACYQEMLEGGSEWINSIRDELFRIGLGYIWQNDVKTDIVMNIIKHRMCDIFQQDCKESIDSSSKCSLYKYICDNFCLQQYLMKPIGSQNLKEITKIRLSSHKLYIETGRYNNIERSDRICTYCNSGDIEDEFHFLLKCEFYTDLRNRFIKKYYSKKPSMFKFIQLMKTVNKKELSNLAKFIKLSNKRRGL